MQPDERLDAWGVCHELAVAVHRATGAWPPAELQGLAAQARRAAFNAALYVADDPPVHDVERRRLRLGQALASLAQVGYALLLAHELGFLGVDEWQSLDRLRHRAEELTGALGSLAGAPPRLLR
jgi:four helix bundle protein